MWTVFLIYLWVGLLHQIFTIQNNNTNGSAVAIKKTLPVTLDIGRNIGLTQLSHLAGDLLSQPDEVLKLGEGNLHLGLRHCAELVAVNETQN